jgi:hypothetical protein
MAEASAHHREHRFLCLAGGRERDMTAFPGEGGVTPIAGDEPRYPEPRAWAQHTDRGALSGRAAADRERVLGGQGRDRPGDGGEVVDDVELRKPKGAPEPLDREIPVAIRHCHRVPDDGRGHRECRSEPRAVLWERFQTGRDEGMQIGIAVVVGHADRPERPAGREECEACVRAAHIGQEPTFDRRAMPRGHRRDDQHRGARAGPVVSLCPKGIFV